MMRSIMNNCPTHSSGPLCAPGVLGGKFRERGRVKKPGQELFKSELSEYFKAQDLFVGATLCLNNNSFQLVDADEYTLNYMEKHAEEVRRDLKGLTTLNLQSVIC